MKLLVLYFTIMSETLQTIKQEYQFENVEYNVYLIDTLQQSCNQSFRACLMCNPLRTPSQPNFATITKKPPE